MDARFMRLAFSLSADVLTDFDFCVTLKLVKQYRLLRKHKRLNSVKMLVFEVFTGLPMNLMNAESFEDLLQTVQLAIHTCGDKKIWAMRKEGLSLGLKFLKQLAPAANVKTETLSPGQQIQGWWFGSTSGRIHATTRGCGRPWRGDLGGAGEG